MKTLQIARAEAGLTLEELEEKAGVARETISAAERGLSKPRLATLAKLAQALGRPVEVFLQDRDSPKAPAPQLREKLAALPPDEIRTLLNGVWGAWTMDPESNARSAAAAKRKCKDLGVKPEELREALMYIAPLAAGQLQRSQREYERAISTMEERITEGA